MAEFEKQRNISYGARDFDQIKTELTSFVKQYFPSNYSDLSEGSGANVFLELVAYLGDVLNFYIDRQFKEVFSNSALEAKNIYAGARNKAFDPPTTTPASVLLTFQAQFPQSQSGDLLFTVLKGTQIASLSESPNIRFEVIDDVNLAEVRNRTVATTNGITTITVSGVSAIAGSTKVVKVNVGTARAFTKIDIPDPDVLEVLSCTSTNGDIYYQVDHLSQETIFLGDHNPDPSTSGDVPFIMRAIRTDNKFVVERAPYRTNLRFGSGTLGVKDSLFIPNPDDFIIPPSLKGSVSGSTPTAVNPTDFLSLRNLGVAPSNTTLVVTFRSGGGLETNVGANSLTDIIRRKVAFNNSVTNIGPQADAAESSLTVTNLEPAAGGAGAMTPAEIKEFAAGNFGSQNRVVSLQDYQARLYSMPQKFGRVYRAQVEQDPNDSFSIKLYVLSQDSEGRLTTASQVLKNNIQQYLKPLKMLTDSVQILDASIINLGISFEITANDNQNVVLARCIITLQNALARRNLHIGQPIVISDLIRRLQSVAGVESVLKVQFENRTGTVEGRNYSNFSYNVDANTKRGIMYPPKKGILEIKYQNLDILGTVIS